MTGSTLDTTPQARVWGVGSNAEPTRADVLPYATYTAAGQALARAGQGDYFGWLDHIRPAAGCTRPIRLVGTLDTVDPGTGARLDRRHTDSLPDRVIYKACGNRRASLCPSCAQTYQYDAYQLLRAGLVGGKGVPDSVSTHPAVFVTLTAPSFGPVHTRIIRKHTCRDRRRCDCRAEPCHPRRDTPTCPHGQPAVCWTRHEPDDPATGQPLCLDCYDYGHQAVWNLFSGKLWHRTKHAAERHLIQLAKRRGIPSHRVLTPSGSVRYLPPVRLAHGKVAEMQRRGAVHFHALLRLDGVDPTDPTAIVPPPAGIDIDDLVTAIDHASRAIAITTPTHPDQPAGWPVAWGDQVDIRPINLDGTGDITDQKVAGYLAKYATKSTEATGHTSTRLTAETVDAYADPDGDHTNRLIHACWHLGRPTGPTIPLSSRPCLDRPATGNRRLPFDEPWTCPDCGTRTRYPACPSCVARRQADLDTQPTSADDSNPYARLRRWAHMLGYGGHFLTKARRYSVTFTVLRETRTAYRRGQDQDHAHPGQPGQLVDEHDDTLIIATLAYTGTGWPTLGDALLANTAAALARERRQTAREELAHELATPSTPPIAA